MEQARQGITKNLKELFAGLQIRVDTGLMGTPVAGEVIGVGPSYPVEPTLTRQKMRKAMLKIRADTGAEARRHLERPWGKKIDVRPGERVVFAAEFWACPARLVR